MMSKEEKKAVERIEKHLIEMLNKYESYNDCLNIRCGYRNGDIKTILNLIENQQKELNSLKEIEQSHQEENGKLRVELEKEKEENKELLEGQIETIKTIVFPEFLKDFISKDKIKEKIKFYKEKCVSDSYNKGFHDTKVDVLEELLEEV